jgi:hypothetical protein
MHIQARDPLEHRFEHPRHTAFFENRPLQVPLGGPPRLTSLVSVLKGNNPVPGGSPTSN